MKHLMFRVDNRYDLKTGIVSKNPVYSTTTAFVQICNNIFFATKLQSTRRTQRFLFGEVEKIHEFSLRKAAIIFPLSLSRIF